MFCSQYDRSIMIFFKIWFLIFVFRNVAKSKIECLRSWAGRTKFKSFTMIVMIKSWNLSSLKNNAQRGDEISNSVNVFKKKNNGLRTIYSHNYLIHKSSNSMVYICSYMFSPAAHLIWNICNKILDSERKNNIYSL